MNDKIKEEEVKVLKEARMEYPTWNEIKGLLGVQFDKPDLFRNNPLSINKKHASIYSNIDGDIIEKDEGSTPCGIDIPVLLKPKSETYKPLIVILGESALRSKAELKDIKDPKNAPSNVILGTPYAIHLEKCPPKCGVYRKIFDAILEKGYPIYLTDIIKIWWEDKKDSLLVPNDLDIDVFKKELDILKKEINNNIIIVAWGEKPKDALQKKFNMTPDVDFLPLPHPGQRNWAAWKLRIFEKAVFSGKIEYATRLYGKDPNGNKNKTTAEKVAGEAVQSILNCNIRIK